MDAHSWFCSEIDAETERVAGIRAVCEAEGIAHLADGLIDDEPALRPAELQERIAAARERLRLPEDGGSVATAARSADRRTVVSLPEDVATSTAETGLRRRAYEAQRRGRLTHRLMVTW